MYARYRKIAISIVFGVSLLTVVLVPPGARALAIVGVSAVVAFLFGLEKLVRAILGYDR